MEKLTRYTKAFADNLLDLIKKDGSKIKDLAARLDISAGALSSYQNDVAQPTLSAICAIADYFHVPIDWLVGRSPVKDPKAAGADVCEYLGLEPMNIQFLLNLVGTAVETREVANWIFAQEDFQNLLGAIWGVFNNAMEAAEAGREGDWLSQVGILCDADIHAYRYTSLSSLVHLIEDRANDFMAEKEGGTHG